MSRTRLAIGAMWLVAAGGLALAVLLVVAMSRDAGDASSQATRSPAVATRPGAVASAPAASPACDARRSELATLETAHAALERTSRAAIAALRAEAATLDDELARLKRDWARLERLLAEAAVTAARLEPFRRKLQAAIDARNVLEARIASHEAALARGSHTVAAARLGVETACAP